jgi:HEAT repeat protein
MPLVRKPAAAPLPPSPQTESALSDLTAGDPDKRREAAKLAGSLPEGIAAIGNAVKLEGNARVRATMFTELARHPSSESVEILLALLRSDDAHLRTGALDAVRATEGRWKPYLPALLQDTDADVRVLACDLARHLPDDEASRLLYELLAIEREANVCASAIEVLADVGNANTLPILAKCAERFPDVEFLQYSITTTRERILSQAPHQGE